VRLFFFLPVWLSVCSGGVSLGCDRGVRRTWGPVGEEQRYKAEGVQLHKGVCWAIKKTKAGSDAEASATVKRDTRVRESAGWGRITPGC
jgi:hypothetical protein